jgi:hypothetical protein
MKLAAGLVFAAILAASEGVATSYYALEIHGGSRIYAMDKPVRKGRVVLFHRYPDGVYMSLAAAEVEEVVSVAEAPAPEGLAPGQSRYLGQATYGPYAEIAPAAPAGPQPNMPMDSGYGYYDAYWGGGYLPPRPVPPPFAPPSRIGPNGFPILAPPGTAGSVPPAIGPNGFPILAPAAPVPPGRPRPM